MTGSSRIARRRPGPGRIDILCLLLLALAAAACSARGELPPHWSGAARIPGRYVEVETDLPMERGVAICRAADSICDEYVRRFALDPETVAGRRLTILAFADGYDYARHYGLDVPPREEVERRRQVLRRYGFRIAEEDYGGPGGDFRTTWTGGDPTVALPPLRDPYPVLRHELSHHFLRFREPRPPRWLDEGVAEYLRRLPDGDLTTELRVRILLGSVEGKLPLPGEILHLDHDEFAELDAAAYVTAWLVVRRLLMEGRLHLFAPSDAMAAAEYVADLTVPDLLVP